MAGSVTVWSGARNVLLREMVAAGVGWDEALPRLNALTGKKISSPQAVETHYYAHICPKVTLRGVWTDERVNLLLALRADGVEYAEIKAAINALPGAPIVSAHAVNVKHIKLMKVLQSASKNPQASPADTVRAAAGIPLAAHAVVLDVSSLNSPPAPKKPEAIFKDVRLSVTYDQARRWAMQNGLCTKYTGLDLITVNAARAARGMGNL